MWRGPSQFFNGEIAPVIPFAIRGAIWCQGTSNGNDGRIYAARMEALVNGWREAWGVPRMPFYFTQMQCYGQPSPSLLEGITVPNIPEAKSIILSQWLESLKDIASKLANQARSE